MEWEAFLFQVTTGNIGPRAEISSASWSISLNDKESLKIALKKTSLPRVNISYWLAPWWSGVLLTWNGIPILAGPILSRPTETFDEIQLDCGGIRNLLARRYVVPEQSDWSKLSTQTIFYKGLGLGTIAKRVVQVSQNKPGGSLPITFPVADQTVADDADHQRTYDSFNLANLDCDAVLTKLSNVTNGPDIMFKPRLLDDSHLVWDMWTGTEQDPRIRQNLKPVWDTTPNKGSVVDLQVTMTGAYQVHRVYSVGAGQDQGTLIRVVEDTSPTQNGYPLLEKQIKIGDSVDPKVVANWGQGYLDSNFTPLQELAMTVRADGLYQMGQFWPGDQAEIYVKGWLSLLDGSHNARLLNMTGDTTSDIRLSLQTES
jgi:hypothetical protein